LSLGNASTKKSLIFPQYGIIFSALFWLSVVFVGLGRGALNYIPWATYNYMADVDEIVTGRRREAAFAQQDATADGPDPHSLDHPCVALCLS
jgi:hypothetical protein